MRVVLLRRGAEVGSWPVEVPSDLRAIDQLARTQLCARRAGCTVVLRDPPCDLRGLLWLSGLSHLFDEVL